MANSIQSVVLGLKPFILVEFSVDDTETVVVDFTAGGGIDSSEIPSLLRDLGQEFLNQQEVKNDGE